MRKGFALKGVCNVCKFSSNMVLQPYRTGGCYAQRRDTLQDFIAVNLYGSRIRCALFFFYAAIQSVVFPLQFVAKFLLRR